MHASIEKEWQLDGEYTLNGYTSCTGGDWRDSRRRSPKKFEVWIALAYVTSIFRKYFIQIIYSVCTVLSTALRGSEKCYCISGKSRLRSKGDMALKGHKYFGWRHRNFGLKRLFGNLARKIVIWSLLVPSNPGSSLRL